MNESGRLWKEAIAAYFKVWNQHLPGGWPQLQKTSKEWASGLSTEQRISQKQSRTSNHSTTNLSLNDEQIKIWKEADKVYFKVTAQHSLQKENHKQKKKP